MAATLSLRERRPDFPFLEATVALDQDELEVGGHCRGVVQLRNRGEEAILFESERPIAAGILNPSTMVRVGGFSGWVTGTGLTIHLRPGGAAKIEVLLGVATGHDAQILELPPGHYLVHVDVPILERQPDNEGYEKSYLRLPPFTSRWSQNPREEADLRTCGPRDDSNPPAGRPRMCESVRGRGSRREFLPAFRITRLPATDLGK